MYLRILRDSCLSEFTISISDGCCEGQSTPVFVQLFVLLTWDLQLTALLYLSSPSGWTYSTSPPPYFFHMYFFHLSNLFIFSSFLLFFFSSFLLFFFSFFLFFFFSLSHLTYSLDNSYCLYTYFLFSWSSLRQWHVKVTRRHFSWPLKCSMKAGKKEIRKGILFVLLDLYYVLFWAFLLILQQILLFR